MSRFTRCLLLFAVLCGCILSGIQPTIGQGILLPPHHPDHPRPPFRLPRPWPVNEQVGSYKIKEISVNASITDQIAKTQVTQSFVNTSSVPMEVSFVFPLPYDGAIDRLTFMVDGKEYDGKLMTKEEARSIYEGYVRKFQDPALLEWVGTGMFQTSVFPVPPGQERKVTLKYTQLLRKDQNLTDFLFPLSVAKYTSHPVEKLSFEIAVTSSAKIKSVYSPTHPVNVSRGDDLHAIAKFEASNVIPGSDFRLMFDTAEQTVGASVLSYWPSGEDQGYFLMLASPEIKRESTTKQNKNIIFVVDRSGSMNGKKIEQAKEALRFVLNNLQENDLFNVIAYDSEVETFRPELQRYNQKTRDEALGFVNGIFPGGSTNISGALSTALSLIHDNSVPNYIVFLTDGLPTAGETNEAKIAELTRTSNKHQARMISFGVGYDVNSRLIDRLSRDNRGQSEYVRPDENIEAHVSRLYTKIEAPVLVNAKVDFEFDVQIVADGKPINRVYPQEIYDIFAGQQVTMVGRYSKSGAAKLKISGSVGADAKAFDFPVTFSDKSGNESYAFVEKLWASRRIGEIIDLLDLQGRNNELVNELIALSKKHGIVTPYTSFLADDQGTVQSLARSTDNFRYAEESLQSLADAEGRGGVAQRDVKRAYKANEGAGEAQFDVAGSGGAASKPRIVVGGRSNKSAPSAPVANSTVVKNANDESIITDAVLQIGNEALYRRGKTLIASNASDVDVESQKAEIIDVERYSDDYFNLVKDNSTTENTLLARQADDQELIIRLRGKIYRFKATQG
jgi:Ca-activated chloride channel homolog